VLVQGVWGLRGADPGGKGERQVHSKTPEKTIRGMWTSSAEMLKAGGRALWSVVGSFRVKMCAGILRSCFSLQIVLL
jgi:hypothetical protein